MEQLKNTHTPPPSSDTPSHKGFIKINNHWFIPTLLNFLAISFLVCATSLVFYKVIFNNQSISRLYQLAQRDSLFSQYYTPKKEGYDAWVYQNRVPHHVYSCKLWQASTTLPLWNPLSGCGAPYLADIQNNVFWPLRFLYLFIEPLRAWNLLIVTNIFLTAINTYILCRVLRLGYIPALFSALICALSPASIFLSEINGPAIALIPFVMACFIKSCTTKTLKWHLIASIACAWMILSGHPEPAFFGILISTTLYMSLQIAEARILTDLLKTLCFSVFKLLFVGTITFLLAAPVLLPFLELFLNSDCYKTGIVGQRFAISLNSILINLIHPAYGNVSPFLGITSGLLILYCLLSGLHKNKLILCLAINCLLCVALMTQLFELTVPMALSTACSWFVPKYCWPVLQILFACLAGFGMQMVLEHKISNNQENKSQNNQMSSSQETNIRQGNKLFDCLLQARYFIVQQRVLIFCALAIILSLLAIRFFPCFLNCLPQDEAMQTMTISKAAWLRDIILILVFTTTCILSEIVPRFKTALRLLVLAICTTISLAPFVKAASPCQTLPHYTEIDPIPFLKTANQRILTAGRHTFCPESNVCYGIANFVPVNVYHPKRVLNYLLDSGVTPEGVNQFFDGRLSPFVDLASVKYVISPSPVLSTKEEISGPYNLSTTQQPHWINGPTLTGASLCYVKVNHELLGCLAFSVPSDMAKQLAYQLVFLNKDGQVCWFSDLERLEYLFSKKAITSSVKGTSSTLLKITKDIAAKLPEGSENIKEIKIAVQIFDWNKFAFIPCSNPLSHKVDQQSLFQIACFSPDQEKLSSSLSDQIITTLVTPRQYKLVCQKPSTALVYENTQSLPQAYVVHKIVKANTENQARVFTRALASQPLNMKTCAVIEGNFSSSHDTANLSNPDNDLPERVLIQRPNINTVTIPFYLQTPGVIVLTDTFYPGWKAYLIQNGIRKEVAILRANYLFRGVYVEQGPGVVEFCYEPFSFKLGCCLFIFGLGIIVYCFFRTARHN